MRDSSILLATKDGPAAGNADITKLWKDYFSTLLNSVNNDESNHATHRSECESIERGLITDDAIVVTLSDVQEGLKSSKLSKATGVGGPAAEHFGFFFI